MRLLGSRGVLAADTADALRKAVEFRNVHVREYIEVSDDIVTSRLADLSDLGAFVKQVAAHITSHGADVGSDSR